MKVHLQLSRISTLMLVCLFVCLISSQSAFAESKPYITLAELKTKEPIPVKKKFKARPFSSRNNSSVKIYPDFIKREMHVVAKDNNKAILDFFVFDTQGTLVFQKKMKANDHESLKNFARGKYIYRVFNNDEETAAGEIEFR